MTLRYIIKCDSCDATIITRTGVGHGNSQIYIFSCPRCTVELGLTILLDQENAGWKFRDLHGCTEVSDESDAEYRINFSSEYIVRKDTSYTKELEFTPYMHLTGLVRNFFDFQKNYARNRSLVKDVWPKIKRARVHLQRKDNIAFTKELNNLGPSIEPYRTRGLNNPGVLSILHEHYRNHFCNNGKDARQFASERILAVRNHPEALAEMKKFFLTDNRAERLIEELWNIDDQWAKLYNLFGALEVIDHLQDPSLDISTEYTLSEKPFQQLKAFYVDCFETLARLSVIAAAVEGILASGAPKIPTRKGGMNLDQFSKVPNGSKPDQLKSLPCWFLFSDVYDHTLRNGMGHHAAQYVAKSDEVHYQNQSATSLLTGSMPYMEFCIKLRKMYHALTIAATYGQWMWHLCQITKKAKVRTWKR